MNGPEAHGSPVAGGSAWWFATPCGDGSARTADVSLFCLPHAGAGPIVFREWSTLLDPRIDVVPVQYPGRPPRLSEPPETSLKRLAQRLAGPVAERAGEGPYALFGHSMGALVAYEVACLLTRLGQPPVRLLVSGQTAPHLYRPTRVHALSDEGLVDHIRRLQGTPEDVLANPSLLELLLPVLRADFALCESYGYEEMPPLTADVTVLGGTDDPGVAPGLLDRWGDLTGGACDVRVLPGGHFYLFDQLPTIMDLIESAVRPAGGRAPGADRERTGPGAGAETVVDRYGRGRVR
jgi:surfactin synthase thioesterase subunit